MRQTGGTAVGDTSTRSSCCCSANSSALDVGMTPSCSLSAPITRTSVARMALLMFTVGFAMTAPPGWNGSNSYLYFKFVIIYSFYFPLLRRQQSQPVSSDQDFYRRDSAESRFPFPFPYRRLPAYREPSEAVLHES